MLFLKGADQSRFGSLLTEWRQAYANNCDLYPEDLYTMVDVMRVMPVKKTKMVTKTPKQEDVSPAEEVGLAQTGKPSCFCCGDPHYLRDCKKKGVLPKDKWIKPEYWKQEYVDAEKKCQEKKDKEKAQASLHLQVPTVCGFYGL